MRRFQPLHRILFAPKSRIASARTMTTDYQNFSHEALIARVGELEARLAAQVKEHQRSTSTSTSKLPERPKKIKKAAKPFDPSKYHTRPVALKLAYLGGEYNGFEHHANNETPLPTIEEVLWRAMMKTKLIIPHFGDKSQDEVCWDGLEYSKCGRTDKGVSAYGQVISLKLRSARPKLSEAVHSDRSSDSEEVQEWHPIHDELPYIALLNRVLPPTIRILAWCPDPKEDPAEFSARFDCRERRYRYIFTNPGFYQSPVAGDGELDISAMKSAAKKFEGVHDFRNFCKVDPGKQITNFERRIFHADVFELEPRNGTDSPPKGRLCCFDLRGSAFLWHQVRHMVAILFLVGQGFESPDIVDDLMDVNKFPGKPHYEMADDAPLVLYDCIFPTAEDISQYEASLGRGDSPKGYRDSLKWIWAGDELLDPREGRPTDRGYSPGTGKHERNGIMPDLWAVWRKHKIEEELAGELLSKMARSGSASVPVPASFGQGAGDKLLGRQQVFAGGDRAKNVGTYVPISQRELLEAPAIQNARYAERKGLVPSAETTNGADRSGDD